MFNVGNSRVTFKYDMRTCTCEVYDVDTGKVVSLGVTVRSRNDSHNKNVARKVALGRAIADFPRTARRLYWEKYFAARHGKK